MTSDSDAWMDTAEAARLLGFKSAETVRKYARSGELPARRFGRSWRIHKSALEPPEAPAPLLAPRNRRSAAQQRKTR